MGVFDSIGSAVSSSSLGFMSDLLFSYSHPEKYVKENNFDAALWALQTRYNSPANQVARLKEAGLNPNLAYSMGNTGNASAVPSSSSSSIAEHDTGFDKVMNLISNVIGLRNAIKDANREDKKVQLAERAQDLDALKFQSAIDRQRDALELEKNRMLVDLAFKDRDYNLRKADFDFRKSSYQPRQDSATTLMNKIISNTIGKPVTDVATDTHNILERGFGHFMDTILAPHRLANYLRGYFPQLKRDLSRGKVRY